MVTTVTRDNKKVILKQMSIFFLILNYTARGIQKYMNKNKKKLNWRVGSEKSR